MLSFVFYSVTCKAFGMGDLLVKLIDYDTGDETIRPEELFSVLYDFHYRPLNSTIDNLKDMFRRIPRDKLKFSDLYKVIEPLFSLLINPDKFNKFNKQLSTLKISDQDLIDCNEIATILRNNDAVRSIKKLGNILGINKKLLVMGINEIKKEDSCKNVTLSDISRALDIDPTYLFKFFDQIPRNNDNLVSDFIADNIGATTHSYYINFYDKLRTIVNNNNPVTYSEYSEIMDNYGKPLFSNITKYYNGLFTKFIKEVGRIYTRTFMSKSMSLNDKLKEISSQLHIIAKASNSSNVKNMIGEACDALDELLNGGISIDNSNITDIVIKAAKNITSNENCFNVLHAICDVVFYNDSESSEMARTIIDKVKDALEGIRSKKSIDWIILKAASIYYNGKEDEAEHDISVKYQVYALGNISYVENDEKYKFMAEEHKKLSNFVDLSSPIYSDVIQGDRRISQDVYAGIFNGTIEMSNAKFFAELNQTLKFGKGIDIITSYLDNFETIMNKFFNRFPNLEEKYGINVTKIREEEEYFAKPIKSITETVKNYSKIINSGCNSSSLKNYRPELFNANMNYRDLYEFFDLSTIVEFREKNLDLNLDSLCQFFYKEKNIGFSTDGTGHDYKFYNKSLDTISESLYNDANKTIEYIMSFKAIDALKMLTNRNFSTLFNEYSAVIANVESNGVIKIDDVNQSLVAFGDFFGLAEDSDKSDVSLTGREWTIISLSIIAIFAVLAILSLTIRACNMRNRVIDSTLSDDLLTENILTA